MYLILLISEMMKIPRAKVEAYFLKKIDFVVDFAHFVKELAYVTIKGLTPDGFGK